MKAKCTHKEEENIIHEQLLNYCDYIGEVDYNGKRILCHYSKDRNVLSVDYKINRLRALKRLLKLAKEKGIRPVFFKYES